MRVLLIDDEPLARRELRRLLAAFPDVAIVGEAANVDEAERKVAELSPDLLLLDIQMPGATGFDLLARLERVPQVIFTTAFDQHAVKAFDVNALDYLLKPVEPARLAAALARVKVPEAPDASPLDQIFVRDGGRCWLVPLDEVRVLASEGNYTRLVWRDVEPLLLRSLVALEERLNPVRFFRANRKEIINLEFLESMNDEGGGRLRALLRGGTTIEISRRQAREFARRHKP
jgi:two-component system LytT family response regulator